MGVETLIRDRFAQAKEYAEATKARGAGVPPASTSSTPPRRDLQLEALAEILSGARIVHCHSYRQDEIVMLTRIAREFGFKIGTFQHILEGYKVADYVRDYSGGGSGFADWWAYKIEVQDAIANGLPLMAEVGVTTSFNSDSDELARRLNVEAGKAVKYSYGRISRADALKFVTLNPAKQLQIDYRVGTLEPGRDADLVVWSGEPMSPFTKAERTFVDGRELFSLEQDAAHRAKIAAERTRIIQKLLSKPRRDRADRDAASGTDGSKPSDTPPGTDMPQPRRGRRRPPSAMPSSAAASTTSTSSGTASTPTPPAAASAAAGTEIERGDHRGIRGTQRQDGLVKRDRNSPS
jgi:N-acetylglucosamine-6-phosphate deacetylase